MDDSYTVGIHYRNGVKDYTHKFTRLDDARVYATYNLHFNKRNGGVKCVKVNQRGIVIADIRRERKS
jgi:hypothetical protein